MCSLFMFGFWLVYLWLINWSAVEEGNTKILRRYNIIAITVEHSCGWMDWGRYHIPQTLPMISAALFIVMSLENTLKWGKTDLVSERWNYQAMEQVWYTIRHTIPIKVMDLQISQSLYLSVANTYRAVIIINTKIL